MEMEMEMDLCLALALDLAIVGRGVEEVRGSSSRSSLDHTETIPKPNCREARCTI